MALERGKIRTRRHGGRYRGRTWRRTARRWRLWRGTIKFALARNHFCYCKTERGGAERRRRTIHLGSRALDHLGLALPILKLSLCCRWAGNLRQPRLETQDGVVQLACNGLLGTRRIVARRRTRDLFDLAGDRVQPLMNVSHIRALLIQRHLALVGWGGARMGRGGIADSGIEPVVQRHPGASCGSLGPLADGRIDALSTPRYARIHAFVRFRLQRATCAFSLPARP